MAQRVSISYHLEAGAGAEDKISLYKVPGGHRFKTIQTNISFPVGQYGELLLSIYMGIKKQLPTWGEYCGDNLTLVDNTPAEWGTEEEVMLHYRNTNATEVREAYLLLEGELE